MCLSNDALARRRFGGGRRWTGTEPEPAVRIGTGVCVAADLVGRRIPGEGEVLCTEIPVTCPHPSSARDPWWLRSGWIPLTASMIPQIPVCRPRTPDRHSSYPMNSLLIIMPAPGSTTKGVFDRLRFASWGLSGQFDDVRILVMSIIRSNPFRGGIDTIRY